MERNTTVFGLALEGGGAKGAFHMGAVKALKEQGYEIGAVAGTSIGALNGAVIAQGDFDLGYEWWQQMKTDMLFDIDKSHIDDYMNVSISYKTVKSWLAIARDIVSSRGLDTKKIRDVLGGIIDEDRLRNSKTDFGLVTVSLSNLKPLELFKEDIPKGMMLDYLMASANFPAFRLEPLEGKYYIDGGFYDNCPVNLLGRKGYKNVIAIRTLSLGRIRRTKSDIEVTSIYPSKDLGRILVFDNDTIKENLKMGYCDTMRALKKLKGSTYYIEPDITGSSIKAQLMKIPQIDIAAIANSIGVSEEPSQKLLIEKLIPELRQAAGLAGTQHYQDIVIAALEKAAQAADVEKYEVYSLSRFAEVIKKNLPGSLHEPSGYITAAAARKQKNNRILLTAAEVFINNLRL